MSSGQNRGSLSNVATAHKKWSNLRIYWGDDSPANFERGLHYPKIRLTSAINYVKKETIVNSLQSNQAKNDHPNEQTLFNWMANTESQCDIPELKERFFCPEEPDFDLPVGEQVCSLQQEDAFIGDNIIKSDEGVAAKGIICDKVEQYVIIEVKSEGMTETSLPKADVWAFLQDHSIGQGPDSRAAGSEAVIDDDSKAGWFHCLIAPENKDSKEAVQYVPEFDANKEYPLHAPIAIERRLEYAKRNVEKVEKKIPLTIDTRYLGQGIVRYKIKVEVVNDMTPEDNQRRWTKIYDTKFGDKPESRNIESGCWLKVWARNAEFDWPDDALIVDALDNENRDAMDKKDESPIKGHPRKARNHTWIRNRLVDATTDRPLYVGLYPTKVIDAINNIEPSIENAIKRKRERDREIAKNGGVVPLDAEFEEINVLLGVGLYLVSVFSLLYFVNYSTDENGNRNEALIKDRKKKVWKIFSGAKLDTVLAAYAVNGFREGFDAAKTLEAVSKNEEKKEVFTWLQLFFAYVANVAFDEERDNPGFKIRDDYSEANLRRDLKEGLGSELNDDGTWGLTGKLNPKDETKKKTFPPGGFGKPLPGYLAWLSVSGFIGAKAGLDMGLKGAWAPENGEFAVELGVEDTSGLDLFGGVDVKALWNRYKDHAQAAETKKRKALQNDNVLELLNVISTWTNFEALAKVNLGIKGAADLKFKYIYDSADKPSIWSLFDRSVDGKAEATNNMLGMKVNLDIPVHLQISGLSVKYNLWKAVIADLKLHEVVFFPNFKIFDYKVDEVRREFLWSRYRLDRDAFVKVARISIGDELPVELAYGYLNEGDSGDVNAWRLLSYYSSLDIDTPDERDADGAFIELKPSSVASYDLACSDVKDAHATKKQRHSLKTKLRFASYLPPEVGKKQSEYQIDFSKPSDTYLRFLKEFRSGAEEGLVIKPGIRVEGMTDRSAREVVLLYPRLMSVDIVRPKVISRIDSKVIFRCKVQNYNDDFVAFAFSDSQWSADEDLKYGIGNEKSHWNLIPISEKERGQGVISIEVDLRGFDLNQLNEQIGMFDGSLDIYVKLSFVGGVDADFFGNDYTPNDFEFLGAENMPARLRLEKVDLDALA